MTDDVARPRALGDDDPTTVDGGFDTRSADLTALDPGPRSASATDLTTHDSGAAQRTERARTSDAATAATTLDTGERDSRSLLLANLPGPLAERFRHARRCGEGAESVVWNAEDAEHGGRQVAVKVHWPLADPEKVNRQALDIHAGADPDFVVRLYERGEVEVHGETLHWQSLEFAQEGDLRSLLQKDPAWVNEHLGPIVDFLLRLGIYLERARIVHRDIKPANLLVRSLGPLDIAITDFGIAMPLPEGQPYVLESERPNRTEFYAPPESNSGGKRTSEAWDWWSIGMLITELNLGYHPYRGSPQWGEPYRRSDGSLDIDQLTNDRNYEPVDLSGIPDHRVRALCTGLLHKNPNPGFRWSAAQVTRWLHGEVPEADAGQGVSSPNGPAANAASIRYFDSPPIDRIGELAVYFAKDWDRAAAYLLTGLGKDRHPLSRWADADPEVAALIQELLALGPEQPDDLRLLHFVSRAAPELAPQYRGLSVARSDLVERAERLRAMDPWQGQPARIALDLLIRERGGLDTLSRSHPELGGLAEATRASAHRARQLVALWGPDPGLWSHAEGGMSVGEERFDQAFGEFSSHRLTCDALRVAALDLEDPHHRQVLTSYAPEAFAALPWWDRAMGLVSTPPDAEAPPAGEAPELDERARWIAFWFLWERATDQLKQGFDALPRAQQHETQAHRGIEECSTDREALRSVMARAESIRSAELPTDLARDAGVRWFADTASGELDLVRALWIVAVRDEALAAVERAEVDATLRNVGERLRAKKEEEPRSLFEVIPDNSRTLAVGLTALAACFFGLGFLAAFLEYMYRADRTWRWRQGIRELSDDLDDLERELGRPEARPGAAARAADLREQQVQLEARASSRLTRFTGLMFLYLILFALFIPSAVAALLNR